MGSSLKELPPVMKQLAVGSTEVLEKRMLLVRGCLWLRCRCPRILQSELCTCCKMAIGSWPTNPLTSASLNWPSLAVKVS